MPKDFVTRGSYGYVFPDPLVANLPQSRIEAAERAAWREKIALIGEPATSGAASLALPLDDIPGDTSTSATISLGETVAGTIDERFEEDWYRVTLDAGLVYSFLLEGVGGYDSYLKAYDENGVEISFVDDIDYPTNTDAELFLSSSTGGTFYIAAYGRWNDGDYLLTMSDATVPDDNPGSFAGAVPVAVGGSVTGTHEVESDVDTFSVALAAGDSVMIWLEGSDTYLKVYDSAGTLLAENDDLSYPEAPQPYMLFTAPADGSYYLNVSAPYETGDYTLHVEEFASYEDDLPADASTPVTLADIDSWLGVHEYEGDIDWLQFDAVAGEAYSVLIDTTANDSSLLAPLFDIVDASGTSLLAATDHGSEGTYVHFVAAETTSYYIATNRDAYSDPVWDLTFWKDELPDWRTEASAPVVTAGDTLTGSFQIDGDYDSFVVATEPGKFYQIDFIDGAGADIEATLFDTGYPWEVSSGLRTDGAKSITFQAYDDAFGVEFYDYSGGTSDWSVSVTELAIVDDVPYTTVTDEATAVSIDGPIAGTIDAGLDMDSFAIELEAGEVYTLSLAEIAGGLPDGILWDLYDQDGEYLIFAATGTGEATYFTVEESGTHTLVVTGVDALHDTGAYEIEISTDPVPVDPLDSIIDSTGWEQDVLTYAFAPAGYNYVFPSAFTSTDYTAEAWTDRAMDLMQQVLDIYESVIQLEFVEVADPQTSDLVFIDDWDTNVGGAGAALEGPYAGTMMVDLLSPETLPDYYHSLEPNGGYFEIMTHELGHVLGLAHPHDRGPNFNSDYMLNVVTWSSLGLADLNQTVYTVMSYNDGWQTDPAGYVEPEFYDSGFNAGLGALDIAALGAIYGFNTTTALGDDVYVLDDETTLRPGFMCIWDNGGTDEIRMEGTTDAVIDLREATLQYDYGGGGYMSHGWGIAGGFTIANGVVIENATGGSGNDILRGNAADNRLEGGDGDDLLAGGAGDDHLLGGSGNDTATYEDAETGVSVILRKKGEQDTGDGRDVLRGIENLIGSDNDDALTGDRRDNLLVGLGGSDVLKGWGGDDRIDGGVGDDLLIGGRGLDTFVFAEGDGQDVVVDFKAGAKGGGHWMGHYSGGEADVIELSFEGIGAFADLSSVMTGDSNSTMFDFGDGDVLVLQGVRVHMLDAGHFEFV